MERQLWKVTVAMLEDLDKSRGEGDKTLPIEGSWQYTTGPCCTPRKGPRANPDLVWRAKIRYIAPLVAFDYSTWGM